MRRSVAGFAKSNPRGKKTRVGLHAPCLWLSSRPPLAQASIGAGVLVVLVTLVLHPGYWINDDLKIAWGLAGYPGVGSPSPYTVYNHFLLGLLLSGLFGFQSSTNWYAVLLAVVNAISIWAILWMILRTKNANPADWMAAVIVLSVGATLSINMTYSITAALSSAAGICMLAVSLRESSARWRVLAATGIGLVALATLLRVQMLLLVSGIAVPALAMIRTRPGARRRHVAFAAAVLLPLILVIGNRLYFRSSPSWNRFLVYTQARQSLHDTHRLNNVHGEVRRVGWTPNDQELFARWFYPDEALYSYEKLDWLRDRVTPISQDPVGSAGIVLRALVRPEIGIQLVWMVAVAFWAVAARRSRRAVLSMVLVWGMALISNVLLEIVYKDPSYVLAGSLACAVLISLTTVSALDSATGSGATSDMVGNSRRGIWAAASLVILLAAAASAGAVVRASDTNALRQAEYARIRADLGALVARRALPVTTLIVSPAHGMPYEWSFPFTLDEPSPPYLDTGWITFSPNYERSLQAFGIVSLPESLIQRQDVLMMTDASLVPFLKRYYSEHLGIEVVVAPLYLMPNSLGLSGYDNIELFRISPTG